MPFSHTPRNFALRQIKARLPNFAYACWLSGGFSPLGTALSRTAPLGIAATGAASALKYTLCGKAA